MNEKRTVVFNNLRQLKNRLDRLTMSELFALNPNRFDDFSIKYDDLSRRASEHWSTSPTQLPQQVSPNANWRAQRTNG